MNDLTRELVEGILGEDTPPKKKIIGMFGGGFKPPTSGHLEVVKKALAENPEMDALIVLVGSGTRDSISQEESLAIWNIYKKSLPSKVVVMASPDNKPPIGAIYSYAKKNPDKEIYWFIGAREGNEEDFEDIAKRTKSLRSGDYANVKVKEIITGGAVSGTKARKALLAKNKEEFSQYIPDIPEIDEIWDMLTDVVKEYKHKYDKKELRKGIEVEKEHTDDPKIALKIALDHLDEDPQYYTKLATLGLEEQHLQERIAYDAETRMQTRFLMKQFLKTVGTKVEDSTEGSLVGSEYELVYGFYPMKKGLGFMPFKVEGSAGPKDIAIEIKYNPELLDKKLYSELSAELRNSVRHELEHLAQYRAEKGVRPGEDGVDQDTLSDAEYLTLDYEIPGHIQGLKTKAKAKKISLQQAIDDLFNSFEYDLDPEEEDFVRETWANWLKTNMPGVSLTKIKEDFDQQDVEDLDNLADRELNPIDVDLSGNHFFDRLNDPRNNPQIDYLELEDFFTKLGDNRDEFIDFLNKYKSVVATDTETDINIPFMKMANKAIAKTVMRKRNFKTPNEKIELEEEVPQDILDSFDIQDTLVPEVWDGNKLKPEVKFKLLIIAQDFFESLDLPKGTKLKDIKLTGSLANYNWSKFSDFDLHLVLDFSEIDDNEEFVRNYFMAKKGIWNDAHDITIYDFPVEVYVENEGESHTASGLYSILNDDWIVVPKQKEVMIDKDDISSKAEGYISQFEDVQKLYSKGEYEKVIDKVDKIKERLSNMRSSGLEKGGEYSVENLAFKVLRRSDIIGQLNDLKSKSYDTLMTINEEMESDLHSHISSLTDYMAQHGDLNLKPYPKLEFIEDNKENASNIFGRTAYYMPSEQKVVLYTLDRHPKDVLRSYAHELIHHHQNLEGTLNHSNTTNTNEDGDLDKIEREAYENGNILFRNWEDSLKN